MAPLRLVRCDTMQAQDLTPHLQKMEDALGTKLGTEVSSSELEAELKKYLDQGHHPDAAIRSILRNHGVMLPAPAQTAGPTTLSQLKGGMNGVNLHVRILAIGTRTITARGEEKTIITGLLGDETGTMGFTSWRGLQGVDKGSVLKIMGAYTKEFRNEVSVNLGTSTRIQIVEEETLGKTPVGGKPTTVAELTGTSRNFELTVRVLSREEREVMVQGNPKTLYSGQLADESGKIPYTAWEDLGLQEGQTVRIKGAYMRSFRDEPQVNMGDNTEIEVLEDSELPDASELDVATKFAIRDIVGTGRSDAEITGTVVQMRPDSGLVSRCPVEGCRRIMKGNECYEHGQQNGESDLRLKVILDDGTECIQTIAGADVVVRLLGKDLDACKELARESMRMEIVAEQLEPLVVGRTFTARGFSRTGEYGDMFLAREFVDADIDVEAEAAELLDELVREASA